MILIYGILNTRLVKTGGQPYLFNRKILSQSGPHFESLLSKSPEQLEYKPKHFYMFSISCRNISNDSIRGFPYPSAFTSVLLQTTSARNAPFMHFDFFIERRNCAYEIFFFFSLFLTANKLNCSLCV